MIIKGDEVKIIYIYEKYRRGHYLSGIFTIIANTFAKITSSYVRVELRVKGLEPSRSPNGS